MNTFSSLISHFDARPSGGKRGRRSANDELHGVGVAARGLLRVVGGLSLVGLLIALAPLPASAASYGEVGRYGCYEENICSGAKFMVPVGFAVEPGDAEISGSDKNGIYVLDRTVLSKENGELRYRLQKLSSPGAANPGSVLGKVELPLQKFHEVEYGADAHPLIGLAVDPSKQRVYALVESIVESGNEEHVPVAEELLAWSTVPNSHGELVRAPGYPEEPLTKASLVAGSSVLQPSSIAQDLTTPEALAIDPSNHDVVIEGDRGAHNGGSGPTVLERVATEGTQSGKLDGGGWTVSSMPHNEAPDGLIAATGGGFDLDLQLGSEGGTISRLLHVSEGEITAGSGEGTAIAPDTSSGHNLAEAPTLDAELTIDKSAGASLDVANLGALSVFTAGTPLVQLTNGDFAARYGAHPHRPNFQGEGAPWNESEFFWTQEDAGGSGIGNMGIRLFSSEGKIITTLGGQAHEHACNIDTAAFALAAGENGSLFVLTQPNKENNESDDQVIEFAEGGKGACPQPSGHIKINGVEATGTVTVKEYEPIKFDAVSIDRAGESPFEIGWSFEGAKENMTAKIAAPTFAWPSPEADFEYERTGLYEGDLRLEGDYGVSTFPFKVNVEANPNVEIAEFTAPTGIIAGQNAVFNGSGSKPAPSSSIIGYRWEFGDGTPLVEVQTPQQGHKFASAGTYEVTLTVIDQGGKTAKKTMKVTVVAASSGGGGSTGSGGSTGGGGGNTSGGGSTTTTSESGTTTTTSTSTATTTTTTNSGVPASHPVVLTRAQKLAKALKSCHRDKAKKKRDSCERLARKQYGPKPKPKERKK